MSNRHLLLVVEDDRAMRDTCVRMLSRAGHDVVAVEDGEAALAKVSKGHGFSLALVDLKLPKMDGVTLLEGIKRSDPALQVVIMTGHATIKSAVQAMRLGAVEYLVKPFGKDELLAIVGRQLRVHDLERKVQRLESELRGRHSFDRITGRSRAMETTFQQMTAACNNNANVLIIGESGTGKELIASSIHYNGQSARGPFIPVNCAAIPVALVESELFGHIKGAFTGAIRDSLGLFRAAGGGTIFLDEVFEVSPEIQVKLLRTIQEFTVRPVGSLTELPIDVRIIAATNQEPSELLLSGMLRKDLYYRLSVITIQVPPLRERPEDIPLLIEHSLGRHAERYGFHIGPIHQEAMDVLCQYDWPGNVREVENLVERWFAMGRTGPIGASELPAEMQAETPGTTTDQQVGTSLHDLERQAAQRALAATGDNKTKAASLLGISRKKLYKLLGER